MQYDDIFSLVESIPDGQQATAVVQDSSGNEHKHDCVFKSGESPCFFLLFPSGVLPADIDLSGKCIFTGLNNEGTLLTFGSSIIDFTNNRILELEGTETIRPEELREFFRVDLRVPATISYTTENTSADNNTWQCSGETIDISQSGVLVMLTEECRYKKDLQIKIELPNPEKIITVIGRMIRKHRMKRNRWLTAFHFENLDSIDRDAIAKNCFSAQRRQLRENVQTAR